MRTIRSWDEVPRFASEEEESAFWASHQLGDELLARMGPVAEGELPPPRPRTRPVAIRFDDATLQRLRVLADRRGKGYQTLLKEFVLERLYEEEKREGIVR
ncbi:MAG TPA: CopG family antitoxin [Candidatus Dormibacteraeota bacterium]